MQVENIMLLADEWADECAGCDSSHLTESSLRRKVLQRAVEELNKDAERYRWMRSLEHCNEAWCFIGEGNANSNLDKAIDAAIRALNKV